MRVPSLLLSAGFAALASAGCASSGYDHRDEMYRAEQTYRPQRNVDRPGRTASRSLPRPRQAQVQTVSKRSNSLRKGESKTAAAPARQRIATPAPPPVATKPGAQAAAPAAMAAKPTPTAPGPVATPPASAETLAPSAPSSTSTTLATPANAAPVIAKPAPPPPAMAPAAPATAAPQQQPAATADPAARKEIADGYRLLRAGFVKKARERFERAKAASPGEATLAEARSMDPTYLSSVAFPDVQPDAEQARRLYRRAIMLGSTEAKVDLDRLEGSSTVAAPSSPAGAAQPQ